MDKKTLNHSLISSLKKAAIEYGGQTQWWIYLAVYKDISKNFVLTQALKLLLYMVQWHIYSRRKLDPEVQNNNSELLA